MNDNIPAPAAATAYERGGDGRSNRRGIDVKGSTGKDKRDYSVDDDSMQLFEYELLDDSWVLAAESDLKNIYNEEELERSPTVSKMEIVQNEGDRNIRRMVDFYSLDAIIAVGYRINSKSATRFRQWATATLREIIQKGLNDDLMA